MQPLVKQVPQRDGSHYILPIQYLRGIAALAVVLAHIASLQPSIAKDMPLAFPEFTGFWGVDIFFVISGFIIVYITRNVPSGVAEAGQFFAKRVIRIVPAYWFFTVTMFLISNAHWLPGSEQSNINSMMLIKSLLFIKPGFPLLFVGWTLTLEMFFYLVFAIGMVFFQHRQRVMLTCGLFVLLSALPLMIESGDRYFKFYTQAILLEFVAGMVIASYYQTLKSSRYISHAWMVLLAGVALLLASTVYFELSVLTKYRAFLWGIPAVLIVFGALHLQGSRLFSPAQKLGAISYSLYLCHMPCAYISAALVLRWVAPAVNVNWVYCLLALFTSLTMAAISYHVFEKYCDKTLKKIFHLDTAAKKVISV